MNVKYWRAPTMLRYLVGLASKVPSETASFCLDVIGVDTDLQLEIPKRDNKERTYLVCELKWEIMKNVKHQCQEKSGDHQGHL